MAVPIDITNNDLGPIVGSPLPALTHFNLGTGGGPDPGPDPEPGPTRPTTGILFPRRLS
jgi:hypothetical protein